eukprot:jgi/Mesvir1/8360/Mv12615-RA.2
MPPKIKVSQEAFDAAVQENIDEFGMDPAEAIEEALTTFRMQGADVSGLLTTSAGERQNHPAVAAVRAVEAASSQAATNASDAHTDALIGALDALLHECGASTPRETSDGGAASGPETDARKLATAAGAVQVVLQVARCHGASSAHVTAAAFSTLRHLLGDEAGRDLFLDHEGHVAAGHALSWHPDVPRVHVAVAEAVAAASKAHEGNMISFMQHGVGSQLLDSVRGHMGVPDVVAAASRAICSLVVADDEKALASKAFSHSLELGKCGAAELLLEALRKYSAPGGSAGELRVDVLSSLCGSLRRLASNDDICKKVTEAGGVSLLMHILDVSPGPEIARSVFPVLRQLSNSDEVKRAIVAEGGLQRLLAALSLYGADDGILEKRRARPSCPRSTFWRR